MPLKVEAARIQVTGCGQKVATEGAHWLLELPRPQSAGGFNRPGGSPCSFLIEYFSYPNSIGPTNIPVLLCEASQVGDEGGHDEHVPRQHLALLTQLLHRVAPPHLGMIEFRNQIILQGDHSCWPPIDFVPIVPAAGGPLLWLPTARKDGKTSKI